MKNFVLLCLFVLLSLKVFSTAQAPDYLIYKGDTLAIYANPLNEYFEVYSYPEGAFQESEYISTGCWRGYIAYWEMRNDSLFLNSIDIGKGSFDLSLVIKDRDASKPVFADWFTGEILHPHGELIYYVHDGYMSIYEYEKVFSFEKGKLLDIKNYDNSKSKVSPYAGTLLLPEYIKNQIDYSELPEITKTVRVIVRVGKTDDDGRIIDTEVIKGYSDAFDKEALRVIRSIPQWDVLYKKGKRYYTYWTIPVFFKSQKE